MISPRVFYNNNFKCISYLNREKASSADPALALLSLPLTPCVISQSQRIRHWCSAFALFVCVRVCVCRIISWQANALNWNKMAAVAGPLCLPKCVRAFCSFELIKAAENTKGNLSMKYVIGLFMWFALRWRSHTWPGQLPTSKVTSPPP